MSSAENHSMFALSPKPSYLKTSNLCTRVHFFIKITSVFENLRLFAFWRSRPEYPSPWAEYPRGRIFRAHFGQNIRVARGWVFKGRGQAALWAVLSPLCPRVPSRRHLLFAAAGAPAIPLAGPRRKLISSTLGGLSPSRFRNGCGYCSSPLSLGSCMNLPMFLLGV
jgi:hypothetical protein